MPHFRKALLLFNPISGTRLRSRAATVERIAQILGGAGIDITIEPTTSRGSGGTQARAAINAGFDAIFACGGDGTVFDVLQGVAESRATLGVIPLGTGNVLAHDLGVATSPERAATRLLSYEPQCISLGRIESASRSRYFTVAAGVGVHAELIYCATAQAKQRGGFLAYYQHGARLLFRHDFVPFPVEITTADGRTIHTTTLELVAMRVRSFGGPLRYWRPGSSLLSPDLRLMLLHRAERAHLLRYSLQALTGLAAYRDYDPANGNAPMSFLSAQSVVCHAPERHSDKLRVQADGEILGPVPTRISIVPRALNILLPVGTEWTTTHSDRESTHRL